MTANRVYGIDLGTTYSCIAYVDEHGKPVVVPNSENEATTPSVVYFESPDNIVVGQAAKDVVAVYGSRCVSTVKRSMGDANWEYACDGNVYKPQEVSSYILRKVVQDAETVTGDTIKDVVITCPAYFGLNQKEATKQAGIIAGLNVLYVIPEPTAAAIAYGMEQEDDQVILVYDLGGGTFDITLIEIKQGAITVLSTGGDDKLGGKDWDDAIVSYLAQRFEAETGIPASELIEDEPTYQDLLLSAEKCKKSLTSRKSVQERVLYGPDRVTVELTREKFDEITAASLERTISLTAQMLERAKEMGYPKIDKLLLVGGSTYMPQVIERVKKEFPIEARMFDPNLAVAKGAAIFGYKCLLENELKTRLTDRTDQDTKEVNLGSVPEAAREEAERSVAKDFGLALGMVKKWTRTEIINVTSKSFGLVVVDTTRGLEVVSNLVVKDEQVPRKITREFGTLEDHQTQVDLRIMENQIRTQPGETLDLAICEEIDVAALEFDRPLPKNSPIEVTFDLGPDGLLKIDAKDLTTGREIHIEHKTKSIMSQEELQQSRSRSLAASLS